MRTVIVPDHGDALEAQGERRLRGPGNERLGTGRQLEVVELREVEPRRRRRRRRQSPGDGGGSKFKYVGAAVTTGGVTSGAERLRKRWGV